MGDSTRRRRVSRRERWAWSGAWGWRGELPDARGLGQLELGQDGALGAGELGALAEGPGGAGEGAELDAFQLLAEAWPGVAAGGLDGAGQQQRQPAQDDVGADALLLAVVDRAQVDHLLHVAPAAFDLQQLLVAKRDLLGRQVRVRAAQQVLAVEVGLGLVDSTPRSSARLVALSLSVPVIVSASWASSRARTAASRSACSGL